MPTNRSTYRKKHFKKNLICLIISINCCSSTPFYAFFYIFKKTFFKMNTFQTLKYTLLMIAYIYVFVSNLCIPNTYIILKDFHAL